ncbi:MAG: hypothetical protein WAK11_08285 [Candidatus Cybelea sp.]
MRLSLATYALGFTASAVLMAGCSNGGSSFDTPTGVTPSDFHSLRAVSIDGPLVAAAHPNLRMRGHVGPMTPDRYRKKRGPYQYVSDFYNSELLEFDYPKGDSPIGEISGVSDAQGECGNALFGAAKRDFWVVSSGTDQVEEFALGGTGPIKILSESAGEAAGCAMDPSTHNLAVTVLGGSVVVIFTDASGSGNIVADGLESSYFAGYDDKGDLFVDGITENDTFGVVEMASGSSSFKAVTLSNTIEFPGGMQWDGKYMTINDQEAHVIYGYACSGKSCTLKRTVKLSGSGDCVQTWIGEDDVFCPDAGNETLEVYKYPAGGSPIATLTGVVPTGVIQVSK